MAAGFAWPRATVALSALDWRMQPAATIVAVTNSSGTKTVRRDRRVAFEPFAM
jgi:hypothetical protein